MKTFSRATALVGGVLLALLASIGLAPAASAAFSPVPVSSAWVPNGPVHAVVTHGDTVFVGGEFTGGVAALDAATGALKWQSTANGDVRALAMSTDGRFVVAGGAFTEVSGIRHRKLAQLSVVDGVADEKWKASAGGTVRDIVVTADTIYFGGSFSNHNGTPQVSLGAVSAAAGARAVADLRFSAYTDGAVHSMALVGDRLFVGGKFTAVEGQLRNQLASITITPGAVSVLDGWLPDSSCLKCNVYWDLTTNGNILYAASRNAGAVTARDITVSGPALWTTKANGDAQAVTYIDGTLYVGGHFTSIGFNTPRTIVADIDPNTGAVGTFAPRFVGSWPGVWAMDSTSERLYVGGHFTNSGPQFSPARPNLAIFPVA